MITTNVKQLPKGWKWVEIKDIADIIVPTRDKPKQFSGEIPWITLPDIDGFFINHAKNLLSHEDAAEVGNRLMPPNTVLLSCAGSLGKIAVTTKEVYANQQFYGLVAKQNLISPIFLAYNLKNLGEDFFFQLAGVSTIGFFSKDKALGIKIPLPPLPEQKRIAAILEKCDRLRRTRRYSLQLGETFLQSVFLEMFGNFLQLNTKNKFKDVLEIPLNNGVFEKNDLYGCGTPVIWVDNLYHTISIDTSKLRRAKLDNKSIQKYEVFEGDLLFTRSSLVREGTGQINIVPKLSERTTFECHTIRARVNKKLVNPYYILGLYRSSYGRNLIMQRANTATMTTIGQEGIEELLCPIPPLPLQEKFAQIVQKHERFRTQQREAERQAEHLFQTLLHRAFRGELTSSDYNDVDISALSPENHPQQPKPKSTDKAENFPIPATQPQTNALQLTLPGLE
ncbi:restriction endonuclease subunit S [Dolichospermum sp. ST_con]|nr:restriction endonuclease subunit S [Dolichospermum sp. ST_con]MDD1418817.1 restriction endonuclease subunit S [Dolichospermum sp. ST_sed1]MDD1425591.1 restriction endonuclease subunit S [Dolichospermum sp. ST_sed9]MDD1432358.1 restriction endonuclease subunit S [Dolichospermum sp. ST_sed6]MDD1436167.1 restriction endonuclease subunit S [Dolichospermum sp. ST_sed10]MDD1441313.1 restriction endonuclease subunit S [Dolichospermum sp. ST_sed3]MDD1447078.1 restriction endonuclease subunit S [Do